MVDQRITIDTTAGDPWDRQPGETARQYGRFRVHLDLGRVRTVKMTVQSLNDRGDRVAYRTLQQVAWQHRWSERAELFDLDRDREDRARFEVDRKAMVARHRKAAGALLRSALTALQGIRPGDLDAADVVRMVKLATDLERTSLALPTAQVEVTGAAGGPVQVEDLSGLDDNARRIRLAEIAEELGRRAGVVDGDGRES